MFDTHAVLDYESRWGGACAAAGWRGGVVTSAEQPAFSGRGEGYFANPDTVAFVRPGLKVSIISAEIAQDGTIPAGTTRYISYITRTRSKPVTGQPIMRAASDSSIQAASHALANTSAMEESCAACQGPGKRTSVDWVHAQ